ncbi:MAG: twin-arginine translocase TatA/TatE family subunit [Pseudomonadota bacterium]
MGFSNIGLPGLLVIAALILLLFGRGKISEVMGEFGKGISSFKKGLSDEEKAKAAAEPRRIDNHDSVGADTTAAETKAGD